MADEVSGDIENAINLRLITVEQSGNTKKELKQTIFKIYVFSGTYLES